MTLQRIEVLTTSLIETVDEHDRRRTAILRDRELNDSARTERLAEVQTSLLRRLDQTRDEADPTLALLVTEAEQSLRTLSVKAMPNASHRVSLALESSHPADVIELYRDDRDTDALMALRSLCPSIVGQYAETESDAQKMVVDLRARIDDTIAEVSHPNSEERKAAQRKRTIEQAGERYRTASYYATSPDAHGQLASAFADAIVAS